MEIKLAALTFFAVLANVALTLGAPLAREVLCGGIAGGLLLKLAVFLVIATVTMHHLVPIKEFLLSVIGYSARSTRRLIALGLLLIFLLAILYLADELVQHILILRHTSATPLLVAIAIALIFWCATGRPGLRPHAVHKCGTRNQLTYRPLELTRSGAEFQLL